MKLLSIGCSVDLSRKSSRDTLIDPSLRPSDLEVEAVERALGVALPISYRIFLANYGSGKIGELECFGLPRHRLQGDVVLVNQIKRGALPSHYVLIGRDHGGVDYYLDTQQRDASGECPVVMFREGRFDPIGVAENFGTFLINARKATD